MTGNSLRLAGKILVLLKLMALAIYANADLLRPMPRAKDLQSQGQGQGFNLKAVYEPTAAPISHAVIYNMRCAESKLSRVKSVPPTDEQIRRHREQRSQRDQWQGDVAALDQIVDRLRSQYGQHKGDFAVGRYEELKVCCGGVRTRAVSGQHLLTFAFIFHFILIVWLRFVNHLLNYYLLTYLL